MKTLNVIGYKVAGVMCAGLLLACADGRGTNGFKSYQYSKTEIARNQALKEKLNGGGKVQPRNNPAPDDSQETGAINLGTTLPPAPSNRPDAPPVFNPESAAGKNFVETGKNAPESGTSPNLSGVSILSAKVQDLNVTIENELKAGENHIAKALIKGITILPKGSNSDRKFDLSAIVRINGEEVYMEANDVAVKFLKADESMTNFLFSLSKPCEEGKIVQVKNTLQAGAKCRDENCLAIDVILSFETQNPNRRANAILVVTYSKNSQGKLEWNYTATNIGTPKTFEQEGPRCQKPELPAQTPAAPAVTPAAPAAPQAPAQPTAEETARLERERAEREAADNKWCEQVKKEGFSCDDSPGEIARMRNARKASEAATQPAAPAPSAGPEVMGPPMPAATPSAPIEQTGVCPESGINPATHSFCVPGAQVSLGAGSSGSNFGAICTTGTNPQTQKPCVIGVPYFVQQQEQVQQAMPQSPAADPSTTEEVEPDLTR